MTYSNNPLSSGDEEGLSFASRDLIERYRSTPSPFRPWWWPYPPVLGPVRQHVMPDEDPFTLPNVTRPQVRCGTYKKED